MDIRFIDEVNLYSVTWKKWQARESILKIIVVSTTQNITVKPTTVFYCDFSRSDDFFFLNTF